MQFDVAFAFERIDTRHFARRKSRQFLRRFKRAQQAAHFLVKRAQCRGFRPENRGWLNIDDRVDLSR